MGLDMYLSAKRTFWTEPPPQLDIIPEGYKIDSISVDVVYWRKVNWIHQWFVDNVQDGNDDCQEYAVSKEDLIALRDHLNQVILLRDPNLLPPQQGFFFGGTELNTPETLEYYFETLQTTVTHIEEILEKFLQPPEGKTVSPWYLYYRASW